MAPTTASKPLTRRPLDLLYYCFFLIHFIWSAAFAALPLWPAKAHTIPGLSHAYPYLKSVVDDYISQSNDTFMLAAWGMIPREWEFAHYRLFLWIEVAFLIPCFVLGMIGLKNDSTTVYPLLLAYSSVTLVTTFTLLQGTLLIPSSTDPTLDPNFKMYAVTEEERWVILGPLIPFLVLPVVMWVDMMVRVTCLVGKGTEAEAQSRIAAQEKGEEESLSGTC